MPPNEHLYRKMDWKRWPKSMGIFYKLVSYKLKSRLDNKNKLRKMINKCRINNIRIYSQIVINQMTFNGNDIYEKYYEQNNWEPNNKWTSKTASAGSLFFIILGRKDINIYTNKIPVFEYPTVPYVVLIYVVKKNQLILMI